MSETANALPYFRILTALTERPWAITPRTLDKMVAMVMDPSPADLEALAAKLGRPLDNTGNRVERRGNTAILGIEGPIFRYANLFTMISGATSIELAARDLETALSDPSVDQIVLNLDTPGGEVNGTNAFAAMVRDGLERKPIYAYADGLTASAGYWIAAAAQEIVAEESAWVGSIGVSASVLDNSAAQERQGVKRYTIISSQSPQKNPSPGTEAGRAQLQDLVDTMAQLFIDRVAQYRGVSADTVQTDFGRGNVLPAPLAQKRGMIDRVQGFESFLAGLNAGSRSFVSMAATAANKESTTMADNPAVTTQQPPAAAPAPPPNPPLATATGAATSVALVPAAAAQVATPTVTGADGSIERGRIQAILCSPEAEGRRELAQKMALEMNISAAEAVMILKASPREGQPGTRTGALGQAMGQIPNPKVSALSGEGDSDTSDQAEIARVVAFIPKQNRRAANG